MSVATTTELQDLTLARGDSAPPPPIQVTERAAKAVHSIVNQQRVDRLQELLPELVDSFKALQAKGGAPMLADLANSLGKSEQELLAKIGAAGLAKGEPLPAEYSEFQRELAATHGRAPTSAELAARAGVPEQEFLAKVGKSAATILGPVHLRLRTLGAGCSGMQDKLDLDPEYSEKRDMHFEYHGCSVVVDKRSLLYVTGSTVDFHNELNRSGFSISNPNRKTTCGCGSSYSM